MEDNIIVADWLVEFTERIRGISGSRKMNFTYYDALQRSSNTKTQFDKILIDYLKFINGNPLKDNDYFKYVNAYRQGIELNLKYFRHDIEKLKKYYDKVDADKGNYNPFDFLMYRDYVLYMMLKLNGVYKAEFDEVFNVKLIDNRQYSPLSKIPSVLRGELPFKVKEFDIARAYPTFIDAELGIKERPKDVYEVIDKVTFNTLLNMHHEAKGATIERIREQLEPVYNTRVNEVITEARFMNRGRMFLDLVVYEEKAINDFVTANKITDYVRLHDGVFVRSNIEAEQLEFDTIRFVVKQCIKVPVLNPLKTFYAYNNEGKVITTPKLYKDFFEQENFIRGHEKGNDTLIIFKDTNNVLAPFNYKTETVKFLKKHINEICTDEVENRIARDNQNTIQGGYLLLNSIPIRYYLDSKNSFGISFKNGFKKYDPKKMKVDDLNYSEVNGFFPPHRTQQHEFTQANEVSEFQVFLTMACTGKDPLKTELTEADEKTLHNFCCMVGYLAHTYKNEAFSPAIILSDEGANDVNRNGGRGKTILTKALSYVHPILLKGGNEFNPTYTHNFADLKNDIRIYVLDDVPAGFNYDALYTNIVGSISCQRKGKEAVEIAFKEAPKFIITTNWAVRYNEEDTSTNRRFLEYKFKDFFNIDNTPLQYFGHNLFQDWDLAEWNRFYNFIYYCVGNYMEYGLKRIKYDKSEDNFRANFNNDAVFGEFERILNIIKNDEDGFTVTSFLNCYNSYDNSLRFEKFFNKNNIKNLVDVYIKHHNLNIKYVDRCRKWVNESIENPVRF